MSKYPLIEQMGVVRTNDPYLHSNNFWISADDLEKVLREATVVSGRLDDYLWTKEQGLDDTHTARLVCVQQIKREPFIESRTLSKYRSQNKLLIPSELDGKRFKVTFEEIL